MAALMGHRIAICSYLKGCNIEEDIHPASKGPGMSPKGPGCQILLFLLFIPAALLMPPSEGTSYQDFLRRHLDNPKTDFQDDSTYCNLMMQSRGLSCQTSNTFIHASTQQLTSICSSRGKILEGNQSSKTLFPITICARKKRLAVVRCRYNGKSKIRRIRVTCERGLPVHYITHL
ncbi:ribonuclease-like [Hemicordylus capensis]|uniref:ribonuclease-like n=1 Tax=Hemicordylus capensis TaxID=884348 RepID=UPI002304CA73|nr:ribonuclease-like [Hemicordylus capensis]